MLKPACLISNFVMYFFEEVLSRALCFGAFLTNALFDFDMNFKAFPGFDFRFNMTMAAYFFLAPLWRGLDQSGDDNNQSSILILIEFPAVR